MIRVSTPPPEGTVRDWLDKRAEDDAVVFISTDDWRKAAQRS